MAMVVRVKPEYNGKIAVQSSNNYNGLILSNDLSQATLVQIYNTEDELRDFLYTTYTTVGDSYAPSQIDPSLIHAYASEEITHNPARTDYPANTVGKQLNETRGKIDAFDNTFNRPLLKPLWGADFANGRFLDPRVSFTRNSIATYIDRNGWIKETTANRPRFNHDPVTGESLGILLEDARTNLLTNSRDLSNASWSRVNGMSISASDVIGPNGTTSECFRLNDGSNNSQAALRKNVTITDATAHAFSIIARYNTIGTGFSLVVSEVATGANGVSATFNLALGTKVSANAYGTGFALVDYSITPFKDGFFKCELVFTSSASLNLSVNYIPVMGAHTANAGQFIDVYGPMLVKGKRTGSYIPTGDSPVLCEQDLPIINGSTFQKIFGSVTKGTIFVITQTARPSGINGKYALFTGPNTTNGSNRIGVLQTNYGTAQGFIVNNGTTEYDIPTPSNGDLLIAFAFNTNDAITFINGVPTLQDNLVNIPTNINEFRIGSDTSPNCSIKQVYFWPERLSNDELKLLTTPGTKSGKGGNQLPSNNDLGRGAYVSPEAILRSKSRQEFSVDGTGASFTRNIRRDYDFTFEIVDSTGVTLTAQPASSCTAGTDNALTFTAPLGKTLTYAITPVYEN